jgi:hypothetical protein
MACINLYKFVSSARGVVDNSGSVGGECAAICRCVCESGKVREKVGRARMMRAGDGVRWRGRSMRMVKSYGSPQVREECESCLAEC